MPAQLDGRVERIHVEVRNRALPACDRHNCKVPGSAAERTHVRVIASLAVSDEQWDFWNGAGGDAWVAMQPVLDRMFEGIAELLADAAAARGAERVLDVGCGVGATTVAIARRLGGDAAVTGVDISAPMVEAA